MTEGSGPAMQETVKKALGEIRSLRAKLQAAEGALREPVAIVGVGLRLPGQVHSLDDFEQLLWSGKDAISPIPEDRWSTERFYSDDPDLPGHLTTRHGGFLDGIRDFDAEFFGIAPQEAASLDPQQRLVLETSWEALEHAGIAPLSLRHSSTGVFLGISGSDYGRALFSDRNRIETYFGTGTAFSVAAGRIAYFLGTQGPALAIDTACSSSLVALHEACQSLRLGECNLALAGGVNVILTPEMNIAFSQGRMMAADGRCKTFDAAADGYVRGEGCGMLALRRLSDASAAGDRILAVIRGSAINQDGRSGGLTAPNGPAQEAVIRATLKSANATARDVAYVEAHGTGTPLGDPIEVGALRAVYGPGRSESEPLHVGSAKTVIGHLEAAAGVAGAAKAILVLARQEIPPHLNLTTGNPEIDWTPPLSVPTQTTALTPTDTPMIAAVSSFGFSGTNAHMILEQAPPRPTRSESRTRTGEHILALSARNAPALRHLAQDYETHLVTSDPSDLCFTANTGRSHFRHRLAVTADNATALAGALADYRNGRPSEDVAAGEFDGATTPRTAFLFSGQGGQFAQMGARLKESSPVFQRALDQAADVLDGRMEMSLDDALFGPGADKALLRTDIAQPALIAVQCALADLWQFYGITPSVIMGHSLGEFSAAYCAGILSREQAILGAQKRGQLLDSLGNTGAMAAVSAPSDQVARVLAEHAGDLAIAAFHGADNVTLSGTRESVVSAIEALSAKGARTRMLDVPFAAHSPFVDPVVEAMRDVMTSFSYGTARVPMVSTVTGSLAGPALMTNADYWARNLREPVQFEAAIRSLPDHGITHILEVGPHPILLGLIDDALPGSTMMPLLGSLHRDRNDWSDVLDSMARLYADGQPVDWARFHADTDVTAQRVPAPLYPFQRQRHWIDIRDQDDPDIWQAATNALNRQAERAPLDLNAASYGEKWNCLTTITTAVARNTLQAAGLFMNGSDPLSLTDVQTRLGADDIYRPLLNRWLERLVTAGDLTEDAGRFSAPAPLVSSDMDALWDRADVLFADNRALLDYVRHCATMAGAVVQGAENPLETLFPNGDFSLAQGLYERSATMRYINALAASVVTAVSGVVDRNQQIQILEVGAGTGGTTSSLLPALNPDSAQYVFSDVSDVFLDRGRERFGAEPDVRFRIFDMERPIEDQAFEPSSFDLIVSANAVHASRNLPVTLERLRSLLRPGGLLMLVESTTHLDWFDISTGLIEGWQAFEDDLRTDNPLLGAETWKSAMLSAGFEAAEAWPGTDSLAAQLGQHVILARQAGTSVPDGRARSDIGRVEDAAASAPVSAFAGLSDALPDERLDLLRDHVCNTLIKVLGREATDPPGLSDRLMDIGLDSLMALRLRNLLSQGLDLQSGLPASLAFDHPTPDALARFLDSQLAAQDTTGTNPDTSEPADMAPAAAPIDDLTDMTDAEIEALLNARLDQNDG